MKIGHLDNQPAVTSVTTERKTGAGEAASTQKTGGSSGSTEASAQVALSSAATGIDNDSTAEFDSDKVNRIAQAIRDGKFQVNPEAIADKLIANAQELLSRTSSH
jgi:negative regulator of flagellin synthesis FlgM